MEHHKVIIVGGGPAGLTLAWEMQKRGARDVVVLEREAEAGGIPRHCGHMGFGFFTSKSRLTGPQFARRLREATEQLDIRTQTTVLEFTLRGNLRVHGASGITEMSAGKIVLATGTRESSRAARLVGGNKLPGVMNTGELQQRVYLRGEKPFQRPVIVGSEWVSFSSLLTCRHAGIRPVAMLAEAKALDAPAYFALGARWVFGVPVLRETALLAIHGKGRVEAVEVSENGKPRSLACDGVILSGRFRSEAALYAGGFLERDGWAPRVNEKFETSRPGVFAVGNVLGHLETAGNCMKRARELAGILAP
ncbi:MAG: NAD(P)/FAD-dependent oxidoreductase [Alphaproteobacteria bacterium]|nr:NAD(P)/FAD-dependent oxidoreductase [Alphaproteobacteria bacterium]